jgi:hypothetical protein
MNFTRQKTYNMSIIVNYNKTIPLKMFECVRDCRVNPF